MSGFQKGSIYEQIKAYVLEHAGLKVLYISQVKWQCGLDVGQTYNLFKAGKCQSAAVLAGEGNHGGIEVFSDNS